MDELKNDELDDNSTEHIRLLRLKEYFLHEEKIVVLNRTLRVHRSKRIIRRDIHLNEL